MRGKRLDIQGLRALAVALVVLYHLWPDRLTGGYIGVDIFFVISGFLITAHLLGEVDRTGTVSLTRFWARRIRRLLPAAFTVLLASLVAAFLFVPKALVQQTLFEIGASALYLQNWVLAGNSVDYLAAENRPTIVQHFWTLSVEEQFYIFWPLLLLAAIWVAKSFRRSGSQGLSSKNLFAVVLGALFVVSLAFSVFDTLRSPSSAYFITPTRVWEFAAGGLLVFAPALSSRLSTRAEGAIRITIAWVGLLLILGSAVLFDADTLFPGYLALIPVLGVCLLIFAGDSDSRWSPSLLFRFGPAQLAGDLSYAIYLWHWPLIVLFPYLMGHDLTLRGRLVILVATVILALGTKYLVEDPARNVTGRLRRRVPAYAFMMAGILALLSVVGVGSFQIEQSRQQVVAQMQRAIESGEGCFGASAMVESNGCDRPFAVTEDLDLAFAATDSYWVEGAAQKEFGIRPNDPCPAIGDEGIQECVFGETESPELTLALVGDSHAVHMLDPLLTYANSHDWRIVLFAFAGCSGLETTDSKPTSDTGRSGDCRDWAAKVQSELVDRDDLDVVVYSNLTKGYSIDPDSVAGLWDDVIGSGKSVVALRDVPGMAGYGTSESMYGPQCIEESGESYDPCAWTPATTSDFMTEAVALEGGRVPLVDLTPYFCTDGTCHTVIGGVVVYFDANHVSYTFGQTLSRFLGDGIQSALAG